MPQIQTCSLIHFTTFECEYSSHGDITGWQTNAFLLSLWRSRQRPAHDLFSCVRLQRLLPTKLPEILPMSSTQNDLGNITSSRLNSVVEIQFEVQDFKPSSSSYWRLLHVCKLFPAIFSWQVSKCPSIPHSALHLLRTSTLILLPQCSYNKKHVRSTFTCYLIRSMQ